jgi:hypothetical protein
LGDKAYSPWRGSMVGESASPPHLLPRKGGGDEGAEVYTVSLRDLPSATWAAARRAIGTR